MADKPSIVLVHGFWGGATHWAKVILELDRLGYDDVHAVENPLTSLADDAERTRKMVAQCKRPVVLVGHSYGGAVITEAGDQPNVAALVYIAAFAPDAGESLASLGQNGPPPPGVLNVAPDSDGYLWINPAKFGESFCQDLPADEVRVMAVTQKAPTTTAFASPVTAPAWKKKPAWYQISSEDRMIPPPAQQFFSERMGAKKTITLPASHASMASHPKEVAALIDEAAKATAG
jgi:pimeloyl-ACP methyl ester carboxylesterase